MKRALLTATLVPKAGAQAAGCKLTTIVDFPVIMDNLRPLVLAKINGAEVQFIADTGAFYSVLTAPSAAQLQLRLREAYSGIHIRASGGPTDSSVTTVKTLTLAVRDIPDVDFLVGGSEVGQAAVGVLGQNILGLASAIFYDRGRAHIANKQPFLAMQDFDQALTLKPDLLQALIARGELRLSGKDQAGALMDFDAADRLAAKEADVRLTLGSLFSTMRLYDRALGQFDLWLRAHPDDSRQPQGLNGRCWSRAQLGQDLDKALADCNSALRQNKSAATFESRGLVELRLGRYDQAITDYDAALALTPKLSWSLYGRGLAKIKTGHTVDGQADIDAAVAINAELPDLAKRQGIVP